MGREIPEQRGQDTTEGTGRFHDFVRSERSTHNIAHGQGYDRSMRDEPNENGYRGSSRYDRRSRDDGYGTRYERYRTYDRPSRETGEINNLNSRQDGRDYKVSQTSCREELDHRSLSQEDNGKQQEGLGESNNPQSSPKLDTIVEPKTILRHEDINSITKQVSSPEVINEPLELNRVQTAESTSIPIVTCKVEGETVCERPALESDVVDSDDLLSVDASEDIDMSHDSSEVNSSSNSLEHDNIMVPSSHDAEEVLSELIPNKVSSNSDGEVQPSPNDNEMVDVDVEIQIAFEESSSEQQRQERAVQQQQLVLRHVEESRAKARMEHRRTRGPRTQGVLFKRLPDGSVVNADLSEEEIAKRNERKLPRQEERNNAKVSKSKREKAKEKKRNAAEKAKEVKLDKCISDQAISTDTAENINNANKSFIPSPGPKVSAWVSGPPPGMINKDEGISPVLNTETLERKEEPNIPLQSSSSASKLDEVLSSSLLDIGNNRTTWSSSSTANQVAVGPIMSSWTTFSESPVGVQQYQSFGSVKQENTQTSADWTMDFALPTDLLSNAADSDDNSAGEKIQKESLGRNKRSKAGRGRRKTSRIVPVASNTKTEQSKKNSRSSKARGKNSDIKKPRRPKPKRPTKEKKVE